MAAPLNVFFDPRSSASQVVLWLLVDRGVPWIGREVDTIVALEHLEPWYVRMSPRAAVPAIVREGQVFDRLSELLIQVALQDPERTFFPESDAEAIEAWLNRLDQVPAETLERTGVAASFDLGHRRRRLAKHVVSTPDLSGPYRALAAACVPGGDDLTLLLTRVLELAERDLAAANPARRDNDGPWLVGGRLTIADLALAARVAALARSEHRHLLSPRDHPHLASWWGRIRRQPGVRAMMTDHPDGMVSMAWARWWMPRLVIAAAVALGVAFVLRWLWRRR